MVFPFPNPKLLTPSQWHSVNCLAEELRCVDDKPWEDIDGLVFDLYGLNPHDVTIIGDTIRFGAPYRSTRLPAEHPPQRADVDAFCRYLVDMVQPFVKGARAELYAAEVPVQSETGLSPWRFVSLSPHRAPVTISPAFLSSVMQEANRTAASRIVMVLPQGGLFIGLLNQLRFWGQSRARMCGLHIVRQHLSAFRRR